MRPLFLAFLLLLGGAGRAFPGNFAPTQLRISAQSFIATFEPGETLKFPFTLSGTGASVTFLVFTKDQAPRINAVRNGYLGWHYVNKIDTCVYFSPPVQCAEGTTTWTWNARYDTGEAVPGGSYTYYLWGYDNKGPACARPATPPPIPETIRRG